MDPAFNLSFDEHEEVVFVADEAIGLAGIIAVHSTALGSAVGGCRIATYVDAQSALTDALRLSQGMSYKNALAGLAAGGGKSVLYRIGAGADREAAFEAFGRAVDKLGGRYVTAEDVGTTVSDMQVIARTTRHVAGLPTAAGKAGGDPSPWTALGVFTAIEAALGRPIAGSWISVQGLGSVGYRLCERLHAAGAKLVVADIDPARVAAARHAFGAAEVSVSTVHTVPADVFSPNALGAGLNEHTIPQLGAPIVCGGANNQLAGPTDGALMLDRGVIYVPDYVANAGGIISAMAERAGETVQIVEKRVLRIGDRVREILAQARVEQRSPERVADDLARERIGRSPAGRRVHSHLANQAV